MKQELRESDIGTLVWAFEISGLTTTTIVKLAKSGEIPGAWNLSKGPRGWRFRKSEFLAWMQQQADKPQVWMQQHGS